MLDIRDSTPEESRVPNRLRFDMLDDDASGRVILNNDNESMRRLTEMCTSKAKTVLNPILDWTDDDVWEFIEMENLPYCKLYTAECGGKTRLGCIGCPMSSSGGKDLERWPKYRENYLRTFDRMLTERRRRGKPCDDWDDAEDVLRWWVSKKRPPKSMGSEYQMMFEDFTNPYLDDE